MAFDYYLGFEINTHMKKIFNLQFSGQKIITNAKPFFFVSVLFHSIVLFSMGRYVKIDLKKRTNRKKEKQFIAQKLFIHCQSLSFNTKMENNLKLPSKTKIEKLICVAIA